MKKAITAVAFSLFLFTQIAAQTGNPFMNGSKPGAAQPRISILNKIIEVQKEIRYDLETLLEQNADSRDKKILFTILGGAFLYGLLHALGPGHRKTIVFSYSLQHNITIPKGLAAGAGISLIHALSAILLITGIYYILQKAVLTTFNQAAIYLEIGSLGVIILYGLFRIISTVRDQINLNRAVPEPEKADAPADQNIREAVTIIAGAAPASAPTAVVSAPKKVKKNLLLIVLSAGIVPCPGAAMILIFSISLGALPLGMLTVLAMSVGMAVITSIVSILPILVRKAAVPSRVLQSRKRRRLEAGLDLLSGLFLIGFSLLFLLPQLGL